MENSLVQPRWERPAASDKIIQPLTNVPEVVLDMEYQKKIYQHFHTPYNENNRLSVATHKKHKESLREVIRPPPYAAFFESTRHRRSSSSPRRPSSAPRLSTIPLTNYIYPSPGGPNPWHPPARPSSATDAATGAAQDAGSFPPQTPMGGATGIAAGQLTTPTGVQVFTVPTLVEADVEDGQPLFDMPQETWRATRVMTYPVPPSPYGYSAGATRPFHQDYRHYKYFGFAGKGAKTSWAHNPKTSLLHSYQAEGLPSTVVHDGHVKGEVVKQLQREARSQRPQSAGAARSPHPLMAPAVEIVEPYLEYVDLDQRRTLTPQQMKAARRAARVSDVYDPVLGGTESHATATPTARVVTYPSTGPAVYLAQITASPQQGSQTPWTKRYEHYKYHGFAGRGATSSWARNPKQTFLHPTQHV